MHALLTVLRPATAIINRQIAAKTPARELCAKLEGRTLAIRIPNSALAVYLEIEGNQVVLGDQYGEDPDVVISGSLISLARLAGPAGDHLIRTGSVEISGDALLAQQFQKLLRYGRPDLEEELSTAIGDVAAHGVGQFLRGVGDWGREAGSTMRQNASEYLQEESRAVPARYEMESFAASVNRLRDDVARLEARLNKLEQGLR